MKQVEPAVYLIAQPAVDHGAMRRYLRAIGGEAWSERTSGLLSDSEVLVEFAGRLCYRSWEPGLNPNVTKVREDSGEYLANIINSAHGSVMEHAQFTFILHNVSRVFTHELVRHRVGVGISQESMRYVRLDDIPFWWPEWAKDDPEVMERTKGLVEHAESLQGWLADHFGLDDSGVPFAEKKAKTSFMRRFAPDGLATGMVWSANIRTLRWVVEARTASGAEEEIRLVFSKIGEIMKIEVPNLFGDFVVNEEGEWKPQVRKV